MDFCASLTGDSLFFLQIPNEAEQRASAKRPLEASFGARQAALFSLRPTSCAFPRNTGLPLKTLGRAGLRSFPSSEKLLLALDRGGGDWGLPPGRRRPAPRSEATAQRRGQPFTCTTPAGRVEGHRAEGCRRRSGTTNPPPQRRLTTRGCHPLSRRARPDSGGAPPPPRPASPPPPRRRGEAAEGRALLLEAPRAPQCSVTGAQG